MITYSMKDRSLVIIVAVVLFIASVYVLSTPSITGFLTNTGQFTLGNEDITATNIFLNGLEATTTATDLTITGVENSTKGVIVKVQITDDNGNCDEFTTNNGTAYFCDYDVVVCDDSIDKHKVTDLENDAADGQWGGSNQYCNLTGSSEDWQFYEVNGTWTVAVVVTDGTDTDTLTRNWTYNEIRALTYPASGTTVDLGALTLNQWNNGTGQELMQNAGNIIIDLSWNASDFSGTSWSDPVAIDGTNFAIDDDAFSPGEHTSYQIDDSSSLLQDWSYHGLGAVGIPLQNAEGDWIGRTAASNLASEDESYQVTQVGSYASENHGVAQMFAFGTGEISTTGILTYKGKSATPTASIYIWNKTSGAWDSLQVITGTNTQYIIDLTSAQMGDSMVSSKSYFMVGITNQNGGIVLSSDYIKLDIESTNEPEVMINDNPATTVNFDPASGLLNCSSVACSNTNATMDIYWHLELPYGLHDDTYTNSIFVTTSDHS